MQKTVFLTDEADAWFDRNHEVIKKRIIGEDEAVVKIVSRILPSIGHSTTKLLEVGSGEGKRLVWMKERFNIECYGVDPSKKAISTAINAGIPCKKATADSLPYESNTFDILVFGFCLYLCDREDLFLIAKEADRVLKADGWLIIQDFFSPTPIRRDYHHKAGLYSYKMDYRRLFDWHPHYTCLSHELTHHGSSNFTDYIQEWVSVSLLRKKNLFE